MPYRFAIIGCGNISRRHAAAIGRVGTLAAVCDIDNERANRLASEFGCRPYTDFTALLTNENPDIAIVCTPNGLHPNHVISALEHGCHVLCEKPLAITSAAGRQMLDTASRSRKKLFIVKQNRFNPPVVAIKRLIDDGKLGPIRSFQLNCFWNRPASYYRDQWRGTRDLDGGTLFTQFSHFIDILYWFLGDIEQVSGWRANYTHQGIVDFEDTGAAIIQMKNRALGTLSYTINSHHANMEGSFTLFGERGTVKIGGPYLNLIEHFAVEGEEMPVHANAAPSNIYGTYTGSMSNLHLVYPELIKSLDEQEHSMVDAAEALRSIEMIEQIYAASPFLEGSQP